MRLDSLPASGVSKGPGNVATVSLSPASGFPDLKALGLARPRLQAAWVPFPCPHPLGEHQWETDPDSQAR